MLTGYSPEEIIDLMEQNDKSVLLDLRPESQFNQAHIPGAINVPYKRDKFDQAVRKVISQDKNLLIVFHIPEQGESAADILQKDGFDVAGFVNWKEWDAKGFPKAPLSDITPESLQRRLQDNINYALIDVRTPEEWQNEHIPGSINIPLFELEETLDQLNDSEEIVTICGIGGGRSSAAYSVLTAKGFKKVKVLKGGLKAWKNSKDEYSEVSG
ncbi:MAG: hypothetical protein H0Z33_11370 [Bacillaceae bacterium]|nr:hypothetical protein [Bacillaceae bacterium]